MGTSWSMQATVGDHLEVVGRKVGDHVRGAEVLGVRGACGAPPYVVRWDDDGHEGLFFPCGCVRVHHPAAVHVAEDDAIDLRREPVGAGTRPPSMGAGW